MSNLVDHARRELTLAGLFSEDSDYGGMLGDGVLELVSVFSEQGHSGYSAEMTTEIFSKLSRYGTLTPITSDPEEWFDVSESCGGHPMWQNKRNPVMFSKDNGKTWYSIDDK